MKTFKGNMSTAGYDLEESYFFEREREAIEKMRARRHLRLVQGGQSNAEAASEAGRERSPELAQDSVDANHQKKRAA